MTIPTTFLLITLSSLTLAMKGFGEFSLDEAGMMIDKLNFWTDFSARNMQYVILFS